MNKQEIKQMLEETLAIFNSISDEEIAEWTREMNKQVGLPLNDGMLKSMIMAKLGKDFNDQYSDEEFIIHYNIVVVGSKFFGLPESGFDFKQEVKKPLGAFLRSMYEAMYKIIKGE